MKHARIVPDAIVRRQPVAIRRCKSARRSRPCLTAFGQDRPADGAPLLGNRRLHLWRPQLHQPGHRAGVLSQLSPVRGWAGCSVGGVRHRRRRLPAGRHDARTAYPGSPGTRRGVSPGDLHAKEFQNGASVAWNRVPWTLSCCAHWNEESGCEADDGALNQGLPSRLRARSFIEPVLVAHVLCARAKLHLQIIDAGKSPSAESRKPAPLSSFSSQNVYDRDCDGLGGVGRRDQYTDQFVFFAFLACAVSSRVRQKVLNIICCSAA